MCIRDRCWFDPFEEQFISPFFVRLPVPNALNCHSLYTAFSSNVGAWGMWACSLFLSFLYFLHLYFFFMCLYIFFFSYCIIYHSPPPYFWIWICFFKNNIPFFFYFENKIPIPKLMFPCIAIFFFFCTFLSVSIYFFLYIPLCIFFFTYIPILYKNKTTRINFKKNVLLCYICSYRNPGGLDSGRLGLSAFSDNSHSFIFFHIFGRFTFFL